MRRPLTALATILIGLPLAGGLVGCAGGQGRAPSESASPTVSSEQACAAATLILSTDRGAPGTEVEVSGEGYLVCEDTGEPSGAGPVASVDLHWIRGGATVKVGEADVAVDGTMSGSFAVPEDAETGETELMASDGLHVSSEPATFTVE